MKKYAILGFLSMATLHGARGMDQQQPTTPTLNNMGLQFNFHGAMETQAVALAQSLTPNDTIYVPGDAFGRMSKLFTEISQATVIANDIFRDHLWPLCEWQNQQDPATRKRLRIVVGDGTNCESLLGDVPRNLRLIYCANMLHMVKPIQLLKFLRSSYDTLSPNGVLWVQMAFYAKPEGINWSILGDTEHVLKIQTTHAIADHLKLKTENPFYGYINGEHLKGFTLIKGSESVFLETFIGGSRTLIPQDVFLDIVSAFGFHCVLENPVHFREYRLPSFKLIKCAQQVAVKSIRSPQIPTDYTNVERRPNLAKKLYYFQQANKCDQVFPEILGESKLVLVGTKPSGEGIFEWAKK